MEKKQIIKRCFGRIVVILLLGCVHVATPKTKQGPLTNAERQLFLIAHNNYRSDASKEYDGVKQPSAAYMMRMYWSAALEAEALAWTASQVRRDTFDYGGTGVRSRLEFWAMLNITNLTGLGQSIAIGFGDASAVVHRWHEETKLYNLETNACSIENACFNYTQMMWANSTFVGCAIIQKEGKPPFAACDYYPPGYLGAPPYKAGEPCSLCGALTKEGFTECRDGLCQPKNKCSPVIECDVVDPINCLCSEDDYNAIVGKLVKANGDRLAPSSLLLSVVVGLLVSLLDVV